MRTGPALGLTADQWAALALLPVFAILWMLDRRPD
jgi:hypothetical protein